MRAGFDRGTYDSILGVSLDRAAAVGLFAGAYVLDVAAGSLANPTLGEICRLSALAIPVWLGEVDEVVPAAVGLARPVQRHTLHIHAQRDRFGHERRLPALGRTPAGDRVVARQVQAGIGAPERGEMLD